MRNRKEDAVAGKSVTSIPYRRQRGGKSKIRRWFTPRYKTRVLMLAGDALDSGRGGLSRFLKREGLRTSHLARWRKQRDEGRLGKTLRGGLEPSREGLLHENGRLKRRLAYLEECLRKDPSRTVPPAPLFRPGARDA